MADISFIAGGNITPGAFVTQSTSTDRTVSASASGDKPIGVAWYSTHLTPLLGLNDGYVAVAGEQVRVQILDGEEGWIQVGTSAVAAGDFLKPDASGTGTAITASSDGDYYGARALTAGAVGQLIKCVLSPGFRGA